MMDNNNTGQTVQDNSVVTLDYTLRVEGEIVDSSESSEPIQFIQGQGQIIPGLESELYGMSAGDSKNVVVQPENGYGQLDKEAYADIPRSEFPAHIPMEVGTALQLRDQEGDVLDAYIDAVEGENVRLTFNHPLAGKTLHFEVTVLDIREATQEELAHGHIHGEHGEEVEEDDDEEWEDEEEGDLEYVDDEEWEEDETDR